MKFVLSALLVCLWVVPAHAQQSMKELCRQLSTYIPIDGVEFNPGATEVPVDLNAIQDAEFGSISIPVEIDLAEYFDRPDLQMVQGLDLKPDVASIQVNQDGSVFYNGQEISNDIRYACGKPVPKAKNVVKSKPAQSKSTPKPAPKPKIKEKPVPKPKKKSSARVMNGPKDVIVSEPAVIEKKVVQQEPVKEDKNPIDVKALETQNNTDNDDDETLIEGQYP